MLRILGLFVCLPLLAACGDDPAPRTPAVTDLHARLEPLFARYPEATVAVAVRDPHTNTRYDFHAERLFHAASTMKVPVMIEVYRQAEAGRFSLDDSLLVRNTFRSIVDGSAYRIEDDSDDALYRMLGRRMAIRDLVHRMITVSSNLATNLLIDLVTADSVQATAERLGVRHMQVRRGVEDLLAFRQGLNNTATAADLAVLLDALRRGAAVSPEADRAMIDVLLDQQFGDLIPAGLPPGVRVAHKTGAITRIHHDAAIVYPERGPAYVLVVLTEGIEDQARSAELVAEVARGVHETLRPAR